MINKVFFLLPVGGGSGGAHSVMQEASALVGMGVPVKVLVNAGNLERFTSIYQDMSLLKDAVVGYENIDGLAAQILSEPEAVIVATTNASVHVLASAVQQKGITNRTAYYIQDYEPMFYVPQSEEWFTAYKSYGLVPGMMNFAKTGWVKNIVERNHNVSVGQVVPSIDHSVYYPDFGRQKLDEVKIVAMLRPHTPRRAPKRTVRILNALVHMYGHKVNVSCFGADENEVRSHGLVLFGVKSLGVLSRDKVGSLLRETDLFLDLSDYQAFGRTAVEAMACGAVSVVPRHGGVHEYARDCINGFIVDTRSDSEILAAVRAFIDMKHEEKTRMRFAAINASFRYSPELAALSEMQFLGVGV